MKIELNTFNIYSSNDSKISGFFELSDYQFLGVDFEFENGIFMFYPHRDRENKKNNKLFSKWNENEKDFYTKFFLNYFNEIKKMNNIPVFTGDLKEEHYLTKGYCQFFFILQYEQPPNQVRLSYYPESGGCSLYYKIPITINSQGEFGNTAINNLLDKETIKRMWEPFRDKTKYRLQLLHMLR